MDSRPTGTACGTGTDVTTDSLRCPRRGRSSAPAASAPRSRARCAAPAAVEGPLRPRRAARRLPTRCCSACPTREIAAPPTRRWPARRPLSATPAAPRRLRARARWPARAAFGLHPLQTFAGGDGPEPSPAPAARSPARRPSALAVARELARALGMTPFEIDDAEPRRLPRRRLDRLELPGHARGGGRAGRRRRRPRAGDARALLAPLVRQHGRELGRARPRARADRPGRARRRRDGRSASAPRSPQPRRSCSRCSTRWPSAPAAARGREVPA